MDKMSFIDFFIKILLFKMRGQWTKNGLTLKISYLDVREQEKARRWQDLQMRQQGRRPRGPAPAPGAPRRRGAPEPEAISPEPVSSPPPNMDNEMLELMNEYFFGVREVAP